MNKTQLKRFIGNKKIHLAYKKINKIKSIGQSFEYIKPHGLWYACGDTWLDYIDDNNIDNNVKWLYEIQLSKNDYTTINKPNLHKVLLINNIKNLKLLTDKYKVYHFGKLFIDWKKISKHFAGIEFCPYLISKLSLTQQRSRKYLWYLSLEIPSGCLWTSSIIKHTLKLLAQRNNKKLWKKTPV